MISVVLYPPFSHTAGIKKLSLSYIKGMTIKNVLENIAYQYPDLGAYFKPSESRRNVLVTIKSKIVLWESEIAENDEITLLSISGGG